MCGVVRVVTMLLTVSCAALSLYSRALPGLASLLLFLLGSSSNAKGMALQRQLADEIFFCER